MAQINVNYTQHTHFLTDRVPAVICLRNGTRTTVCVALSYTIQNKMLQMFAHTIQPHIIIEAEASNYFGLTADATTATCSLLFIDDNLAAQNVFLGFYSQPDSTSQSSFSCIKDIFTRLSLLLEKLQCYCFNGASSMSGRINGVQS